MQIAIELGRLTVTLLKGFLFRQHSDKPESRGLCCCGTDHYHQTIYLRCSLPLSPGPGFSKTRMAKSMVRNGNKRSRARAPKAHYMPTDRLAASTLEALAVITAEQTGHVGKAVCSVTTLRLRPWAVSPCNCFAGKSRPSRQRQQPCQM